MSELLSVIDSFAAVDVHHMAEPALLVQTEMLLDARHRLDAAIAVHVQAVDVREVTVSECGRATTSWLVEEQHLSPTEAKRRMWVARRLPEHPAIAGLLRAGQIGHEHALVIINCVTKLPADWREPAEAELCAFACDHDPATLAALCRELRVRTGADEDAEAAAERRYRDRYLSLHSTMGGMVHLDGMLDPESAATVTAALDPLLAKAGTDDDRHVGQRRADALVELARFSLNHGNLPDHGGDRPQVLVTIPYGELCNGVEPRQLGHATLNGTPITAATARRLACDAGIIPAVLGGGSEVLDLGRTRRTFSRAQRRAAALRDKGCVFDKCQVPLSRCELHHPTYWEHGGPTDHHNSAYLCPFHHWLVHHTNWTITRNPDGTIEIRRT